jgi:hypothetical protein
MNLASGFVSRIFWGKKCSANKDVYNKLVNCLKVEAIQHYHSIHLQYGHCTVYSNLYVYCINFHAIVEVKVCFVVAAKRTAHTKSKTLRITSLGFSLCVAQFHSHIRGSFIINYIAQKRSIVNLNQ